MCKRFSCLFSLVLVMVVTVAANAADPSLVGWWSFDEGSGTVVADSSGAGHDGVFAGGAPEWVEGMYGMALQFDGSSDVEIPDHDDFHFQDAVSMALWMRPEADQPDYAKPFIKQKSGEYPYALQFNTAQNIYATVNASTRFNTSPTIPNFPGEWAHMCFTYDGSALILYKDGEEVARVGATGTLQQNDLSLSIGGRLNSGQDFIGIIDDVRLFNRALTAVEIQGIMTDAPAATVSNPYPSNGAVDMPRDVVLGWTPVDSASTHDMYLGADGQAVAEADASDNTGIYRGRVLTGGYSPERFGFDETYYWRVDEVNSTPDNTVLQGSVWSFTTELFSYPVENIVATASSGMPGKGSENTVNGSGLDASGLLHDRAGDNMWLSSLAGPQPSWIEFDLGKVHKLHEMWVWNSNDSLEPAIGFGLKDVTIEYSVDGIDYTILGTTHEFTQAPGLAGYAYDTTIDFESAGAKFVRLTANSNWGGILPQFGLSEVRFFSIPVQAREPEPASGATDVALDLDLGWIAGREAAAHDVYFSDELQAVLDGAAPVVAAAEANHGPLALDLGKTYYWRIDEVNDAETNAIWQGDVWDFTTIESLVVDDFESYTDNDAANEAIWQAWIDGFGVPANGSQVGNLLPPYAEQAIVHGGSQSMPLAYNNTNGVTNSEATLTLTSQKDWAIQGIGELSLWFRGYPVSVGGFTEAPAGTFTVTAEGADIWGTADEFHYVYKQLTGVGSIIARVDSVENTDAWAKSGVMIRDTLDAGSAFAAVYITSTNPDGTPTQGCRFQARTDSGGSATSDSSVATAEQMTITAPYWVKIERDAAGNFRGSYSSNGTAWTPMVWRPAVSMGSTVYVGLALTSHVVGVQGQAVFSGVQAEGNVTGQWQSQDIGILNNSAEPLYVEIASGGTSGVVLHDDPAATQIDAWTEWRIALQQFADQGVNLTNVDSISVGIGDKSNPQPGGTGIIYIDDIELYP